MQPVDTLKFHIDQSIYDGCHWTPVAVRRFGFW